MNSYNSRTFQPNKKYLWLLALLCVSSLGIYFLGIWVLDSLYTQNSEIEKWVQWVYPRFFVEQHRLSKNFFVEKVIQVSIRWFILGLVVLLFLVSYQTKNYIYNFIEKLLHQKTNRQNVVLLRILYFALLLFFTRDLYPDLIRLQGAAQFFYEPIGFYKWLQIPFPSQEFIQFYYAAFVISCVLCIVNIGAFFHSIVAILLFIFLQGYFYCFGKMGHEFATYTYVGLLMPLLIYYSQFGKAKEVFGYPIIAMQLVVALGYFFSGIEKLITSRLLWLKADTLATYLNILNPTFAEELTKYSGLFSILPILIITFEMGFILAVPFYKIRRYILIMGFLFHIFNAAVLGIGGFFHPWLGAYICFIPRMSWSEAE